MNGDDDKLLQELGRAVRSTERNADAQREERLSSHSLQPDELAEMQARAERDAELARALDAHAPLGTDIKKRISAELVAVAQRQSATPEEAAAAAPGHVVALPARAARVRRMAWLALPLSVAAAATLWLGGARHATPIAAYDLQISSGQSEVRSGPTTTDHFDPGTTIRVGRDERLRVILRPATAVAGAIGVRVFLATSNGLLDWPASTQHAETGALQLQLTPPPAAVAGADLMIVVGRPELLAAHGAELARASEAQGPGFQHWRVRLEPGRE